jgi:hypothetical protein
MEKLWGDVQHAYLRLPQMISSGPGAAETFQVLVSWCCVLLTAFTCDTCFLQHSAGPHDNQTWIVKVGFHPKCLMQVYWQSTPRAHFANSSVQELSNREPYGAWSQ